MFRSLVSELRCLNAEELPSLYEKPPGSPCSQLSRFSDIYQQSRLVEGQDDRRRRLLKEYRDSKRDEALLKKYATAFSALDEPAESDSALVHNTERKDSLVDGEEDCQVSDFKQSPSRKSTTTKFPRLMLSEWLLEVPSDFEDSWIMLPCPVGKRCSIVTSRGETTVYSRTGLHMLTGTSDLPGGSSTKRQGSNFTVLDCVFDKHRKIFHLLDVIFWNGTSLTENTVEFRLFWLKSRFDEIDTLLLTAGWEQYRMQLLPHCNCTTEEMGSFFADSKSLAPIDGYMFYHKEGIYVADTTPLVCWLKPYMVPEILRLPVPADLMKSKPVGYTTLSAHVAALDEKRPKKPERRWRKKLQDAAARTDDSNLEDSSMDSQNL
ncbi:putative Snurportin-1 [Hypsibius exemplaris]|uniref:Snurportin-1 n=1 Tax=Hypsibius exemplaris TaxID=2072580 RepID=A0A1W0WZ66_HYPEX|nr:putative Snurportin-1 [Hypsibius exemplaris]